MPTKYLIIQNSEGLTSDYDYVDYLLDIEYNSSPSTLIQYPANKQELSDIAYYDSLGASLADNVSDTQDVPIGKLVV